MTSAAEAGTLDIGGRALAERWVISSPVALTQLLMNVALARAIASNSATVGGCSVGAIAGGKRSAVAVRRQESCGASPYAG
jgi:hypothetical protein